MAVAVQLGTAQISVQDLMNFGPGDVLMLDQHPGIPCCVWSRVIRSFTGSRGCTKAITRAASPRCWGRAERIQRR